VREVRLVRLTHGATGLQLKAVDDHLRSASAAMGFPRGVAPYPQVLDGGVCHVDNGAGHRERIERERREGSENDE
jgi:hypothetical protein